MSKDYENRTLNTRGSIVFIHEMFWFMPVSPWIVDGHVRWGCRNSHEDWREEPGDNSKNNSLTWAKGKNPYDVHVAKGSLFRKYSWSCSHFNSKLIGRLLDEVIGESRQFWTQQWKQGDCQMLTSIKLYRTLIEHKAFLSNGCRKNIHAHKGEKCFLPERFEDFSLTSFTRRTFHVMFVRTSMDSESQDATKLTSALAGPSICSSDWRWLHRTCTWML